MLIVRHKQTSKIEKILFAEWEYNYNHELWEILEFDNLVIIYHHDNKKVIELGVFEKQVGINAVEREPNKYSYLSLSKENYLTYLGKRNFSTSHKIELENFSKKLGLWNMQSDSAIPTLTPSKSSLDYDNNHNKYLKDFLSNPKDIYDVTKVKNSTSEPNDTNKMVGEAIRSMNRRNRLRNLQTSFKSIKPEKNKLIEKLKDDNNKVIFQYLAWIVAIPAGIIAIALGVINLLKWYHS